MLEPEIKGVLEYRISEWIRTLPDRIRSARNDGRWALHVEHDEDYALGYSHGAIRAIFLTAFANVYGRYPDDQEIKEAEDITIRRNSELKDAILKAG